MYPGVRSDDNDTYFVNIRWTCSSQRQRWHYKTAVNSKKGLKTCDRFSGKRQFMQQKSLDFCIPQALLI